MRILRRNSARGDSGAIVVGAARAEVQDGRHRRVASSNYGSRVDCYAWGEAVTAPSSTAHAPYATTACTGDFGETSAAAAIIAGVALIVQGVVAQAEPGRRVAPGRLREILGDPALGTGCVIAQGRIGVMPDLARILTPGVLGVTLRRAPHSQAADANEEDLFRIGRLAAVEPNDELIPPRLEERRVGKDADVLIRRRTESLEDSDGHGRAPILNH